MQTESELDQAVLKAIDRSSSVEVLSELSKHEDALIRELVAENINCPEQILRELSKDPVDDVRRAVAGNISTPADILVELGFDRAERVRDAVVWNSFCPIEALCMVALREHYLSREDMPIRGRMRSEDQGTRQIKDSEIIMRLCRDPKSKSLYDGQWKDSFESKNEADLSLCIQLAFWCDRDPRAMARIFSTSGLYSKEWDTTHYREKTLLTAIVRCEDCYTEWKLRKSKENEVRRCQEIARLQQKHKSILPSLK